MIDHEPHVSDLRFDLLLARDLPDETRQAVHDHTAQCPTCAARLRELTAEREGFRLQPMLDLARLRTVAGGSAPVQNVGLAPAYRDDVDAARARCASLESQLRAARKQLDRLGELTHRLEDATGRGRRDHPEHAELEDQVAALTRELRDLELLRGGDAAMTQELSVIERQTSDHRGDGRLELYVAGTRARALAGPVWAPRRRMSRTARGIVASVAAALGLVPAVWGAAAAVGAASTVGQTKWGTAESLLIAWWVVLMVVAAWFCALGFASLLAAVRGARDEAMVETALVGPDTICGRPWSTAQAIRFAPAELVVSFQDRDLVFGAGSPHFQAVVDYARAAVITYRLELRGDLPALPEVAFDA